MCVYLNTQQVKLGQTALREAQKAENVTKSHAAAAAAQASVEITWLQRSLAQVREAGVTVKEVQQHHDATAPPSVISFGADGRGAADFDSGGGDGGGGWGIMKGMGLTLPQHTQVPESSTKAAVRAMRKRRSRSPVPTGEAQDTDSRRGCGKGVSEPEEIGQAVEGKVGSVVEETNADSVRAQLAFIESLFATSGSPSKVAAGAKESGTAAGGPERRNAERQGADASGQRGGVHGAGSGEAAVKKQAEVRVVTNPLLRTSAIRDTTAVRTARAVWETFEQDADDGSPACVPR